VKIPDVVSAAVKAQDYGQREGLTCIGVELQLDAGMFSWAASFIDDQLKNVTRIVLHA
jgi:hypothetical protein